MKRLLPVLLMGMLVVVAGCKKQSPAPTQSEFSPVNSGNGAALSDNQQALHSLLSAQLPSAAEGNDGGGGFGWPPASNPNVDVYLVHALWGTLRPLPTAQPPTDWSGMAQIGPVGSLKVVAQISFDKGQDSLPPSPDSTQAKWISITKSMDVDGLIFLIAIDRTIPVTGKPTFTFNTAPVSLSLTADQLVKFDTILFDSNHDALLLDARKIPHESCPSGTVAGMWIKTTNTGDTGSFQGQWIAPNNTQSGFMMGNFWTTKTGGRMIFGVYTDMSKNTVGYLKGMWRYDDPSMCATCGSGHGQFGGVFTNIDTVTIGSFFAEIGDKTNPAPQLQLPYKGFWKANCPKPDNEIADQ